MASARKCDRCGKLYERYLDAYPNTRVNVDHHPYPASWVDLCDECTEELERWLKGDSFTKTNFIGKR